MKQNEIQVDLDIPDYRMDNFGVCVLASGSRGNSTYITDGSTSILVDAGLSGAEIERRLTSKGISPDSLDAILISHEHSDHIHGAGVLSRRYNIPVYINPKTREASSSRIGTLDLISYFECGSLFNIKTLTVHPFSISHDAIDPSGFTISKNGIKIGMATDLGIATSLVKEHLKDCDLLIIEANHDSDMLINGPYPWHLKQRVKSRTGHLSNLDAKELLQEIIHPGLKHVILAHLSQKNNMPQKAEDEMVSLLPTSNIRLHIASQNQPGTLIFLKNGCS